MAVQYSFKRYEKKYFLTDEQKSKFLDIIRYRITPDKYAQYTICNIYFDTDDYSLIRRSIEKPVYKEKLRIRSYGVAQPDGKVFAEIKKKFDGVVYKRRIQLNSGDAGRALVPDSGMLDWSQTAREIAYFQHFYRSEPKVFISYDRQAFSADAGEIRITFDTNIRYRTDALDLRAGDYGRRVIPESDKILMEIKIPGVCPLWLCKALEQVGARQTSFSKYGECYKRFLSKTNYSEGELFSA